MKILVLGFIVFYQYIVSPILKNILGVEKLCRYPLSCSFYSKQQIQEYGLVKGGFESLKRILSCQPWFHKNI